MKPPTEAMSKLPWDCAVSNPNTMRTLEVTSILAKASVCKQDRIEGNVIDSDSAHLRKECNQRNGKNG